MNELCSQDFTDFIVLDLHGIRTTAQARYLSRVTYWRYDAGLIPFDVCQKIMKACECAEAIFYFDFKGICPRARNSYLEELIQIYNELPEKYRWSPIEITEISNYMEPRWD